MKKVIVIGLDGVSWDFLNPWIKQGYLPNFEKLKEGGCWGILKSVIPPVTCPAWKCYSTGKNPGKLGVFWWLNWDRGSQKFEPPTSRSFDGKEIWDYLGEDNHKVAVINMPTTYPPQKVNGIFVSGFGAPLDVNFDLHQSYTYPPTLRKELEKKYNYKVAIDEFLIKDNEEKLTSQVKELIDMRFEFLMDLLKEGKYDFIHFTLFYINALRHYYGNDNLVLDVWKGIDSWIGKVMEYDHNLIIMSDHGMMPIKGSFCINNWLLENGYLNMNDKQSTEENISGNSFLKWLLQKNNFIARFGKRILPAGIKKRIIPKVVGRIPTNFIDQYIDWDTSKAIALSQGPIYINKGNVDNLDEFKNELAGELKKVKDGNVPIIDRIFMKEAVYTGKFLERAPDILLLPKYGYEIYGGITSSSIVHHGDMRGWSTGNHPDGMLLGWGSEISSVGDIGTVSILDLAPTILHLMGSSVPRDMDGRVLREIFDKNSEAYKRSIKYRSITKTNSEKQKLRNSIKRLKSKHGI